MAQSTTPLKTATTRNRIASALRARAQLLVSVTFTLVGLAAIFAGAAIIGPLAIAVALIVVGTIAAAIGLFAGDTSARPRRRR